MIGFGSATVIEGATQVAGYGEGENGINPGAYLAGLVGGKEAARLYYIADFGVSLVGGGTALKQIVKTKTFTIHTVYKRYAGARVPVWVMTEGSQLPMVIVESQPYKLIITGHLIEAVSAGVSTHSSAEGAAK